MEKPEKFFLNETERDMYEKGFVPIRDLPWPEGVSMQSQYISHYIDGLAGKPKLTEGLRLEFLGGKGSYHQYYINKDDAVELADRILKYKGYKK